MKRARFGRRGVAGLVGRTLLLLYPPEFRRDVGDDLVADLRAGVSERARAVGRFASLVWLFRNAGSLLANAIPEWRSRTGRARGWAGASRRDLRDWVREIRQGSRTLARDRAFSATVVITLTFGIAMTTAVFSVVDGVLLRPLPYPNAEDLVAVWQNDMRQGVPRDGVSAGNFLEWRDRTSGFAGLAAMEPWGLDFMTESGPEEVGTHRVSEDFFDVLGTPPLHGRTFRTEDYGGDGIGTVVVSHGFWRERLGGDPGVVGTTILLDEEPVEVVGVMPAPFDIPHANALWIPRTFQESERQNRAANYYDVIARLGPGASVETARVELDRAAAQLASEYPDTNQAVGATVVPLPDVVLGPIRPALGLLLACSAFVLIIACTNVASLVIARTNDRLAQMGTRAALGAGRRDLILPQVLECVLLALVAGVLSGALVMWTVEVLKDLAPLTLPRIAEVTVDVRVWGFAIATALATSILVGLPSTLRASRIDLARLLSGSGRRVTSGRKRRNSRDALVVIQLALALVLATAATLTTRSVLAVSALDPGYRTDYVAIMSLQVWRQYPTPEMRTTFVDQALEGLGALPGVRAVGMSSSLPLTERIYADDATFFVESRGAQIEGEEARVGAATVTPGFFETLGIPLVAGRNFSATDGPGGPRVVLVNEELARRHFPGESPIGERVSVSFAGPPVSAEIVGVVGDVRHATLEEDPQPRLYIHHPQSANGAMVFTARTSVEPTGLLEGMKQEIWELNASVPISYAHTFSEIRADAERERRFYSLLLAAFAVTAMSIAVVGVYGLGAYAVARQRPEIGIMLALGATPGIIARLFLTRGGRLLGLGLGLGLLTALGLTRFLRSLLYGLSPTDPATLAASVLGLGLIALLATYVPARRASRIDPTVTLRTD